MGMNGFRELLKEFPPVLDCIKPICHEIRQIPFPHQLNGCMLVGTPPGPPEDLYNPIIEAFDKAIRSIAAAGKDSY